MKKTVLLLIALWTVTTLSAQVYVGGGMGFHLGLFGRGSHNAQLSVMPEIGYRVNNWLSVGTSVGYHWQEEGTSRLSVAPYARAYLPLGQYVGLFADALYSYSYYLDDSYRSWRAGICPGIHISLSPRFGLVSRVAFLGYRSVNGEGYFDADLSITNSASLGFYYAF